MDFIISLSCVSCQLVSSADISLVTGTLVMRTICRNHRRLRSVVVMSQVKLILRMYQMLGLLTKRFTMCVLYKYHLNFTSLQKLLKQREMN